MPEWDQPLHPSLPYRAGEVVWAARHEAARSVEDVLARRTRALFLDARASIEAAPPVAALLAAELASATRPGKNDQVAEFRKLAADYLRPAIWIDVAVGRQVIESWPSARRLPPRSTSRSSPWGRWR